MNNIYWIILGYFAIGLALTESIRWAQEKWKVLPLGRFATILVFSIWPFVILLSLVLVWREKK